MPANKRSTEIAAHLSRPVDLKADPPPSPTPEPLPPRTSTPRLDEIQQWGATTDVVTAGTALGIGRNRSYELAKQGKFPIRVMKIGRTYRVIVAELIAVLSARSDLKIDRDL